MGFLFPSIGSVLLSSVNSLLMGNDHASLKPVTPTLDPFFSSRQRPLLVAHRGHSYDFPENTILSFKAASDLGADILEVDLHLTKDGHLIASHSSTGGACTDAKDHMRRWETYTLEEVQQLDAGFWFTKDSGLTYPFRGKSVRIPTFFELLNTLPQAQFWVDLKYHQPSSVEAYIRELDTADAWDRVITGSFDSATLQSFRERNHRASATSLSQHEALTFIYTQPPWLPSSHETAKSRQGPIEVLAMPSSTTMAVEWGWAGRIGAVLLQTSSQRFIQQARARGKRIIYWTVNDKEEMAELLRRGADGVITDNVALAVEAFREAYPAASHPRVT